MLRALFRLLAFAITASLHFFRFLLKAPFTKEDKTDLALRIRRRWIRFFMPVLGVELHIEGEPPTEPGIIAGNHLSYLDPVAVLHDALALPVAKAEVSKWPVIGGLAKGTGILFVERGNRESRASTREAIRDAVQVGRIILNYPEGTTHAEPFTLPFRKGIFYVAAAEGFPVYPVAIWYGRKEAAWIDDDTFLPHFIRTFRHKKLDILLRYGLPYGEMIPKHYSPKHRPGSILH
ncbi:MAG: lysophospholipid acyltransferase family protein [Bacteroidia bacterium]